MADSKITALTSISTSTDPANDPLVIVDVSDTSMAATGTAKKVTLNQLLGASGTATLASATITGDLTVDTSTLKVDSANNRVGIGTASPANQLSVRNEGASGIAVIDVRGGSAGAGAVQISGNATTLGTTSFDLIQNSSGAFVNQRDANPLSMFVNGSERYAISSSGVATWSNVGGVAGTAMTLNSTGLGVGGSPNFKLDVAGAANSAPITLLRLNNTGTTGGGPGIAARLQFNAGATALGFVQGCNFASGSIGVQISGDGTNIHQTIDSSGNVGIGVTPSAWGGAWKVIEFNNGHSFGSAGSQSAITQNAYNNGTNWIYKTSTLASLYQANSGVHYWYNAPSGTAGNAITFTQAMTLDASGNLLVRCTTAGAEQLGFQVLGYTNGNYVRINHNASAASGDSYLNFLYNATQIGSITQNGTTGVLYNIISDYRLKESVQPLVGGLARVNALKPSVYKWKSDGSTGEGFLAHELAEVVPFAVTGEKDAVNEDGSIKSQGIDMSRVVPILVAAIQELAAEVNALKNA